MRLRRFALSLGVLLVVLLALPQASAPTADTWRLVEEWRTGSGAIPAIEFSQVRDLDLASDGSLIVLDGGDQRLHFIGTNGRLIRSVGTRGSGPGEFRDASGVAVAPSGEIVVADFPNGRLVQLAPDGRYLKAVPTTRAIYRTRWLGFFEGDVLHDPVYARSAPGGAQTEGWQRRDANLALVDSVTTTACTDGQPRPGDATIPLKTNPDRGLVAQRPFASPITASVAGPGAAEWGVRRFGQAVLVPRRFGSCAELAAATLTGRRRQVTAAERQAAETGVRQYAERVQALQPDLGTIPREYPWYFSLMTDARGQLWVDRLTAEARQLDVFGVNGNLLAVIPLEIPLASGAPVVITNERFYGFVSDADGLLSLVALRIERR